MTSATAQDPYISPLSRPTLREIRPGDAPAEPSVHQPPADEQEKALPLPRWLERVYFIFPIVLYLPDVIFNYFVYSDGAKIPNADPFIQISQVLLWGFMSVGVVGMAYLLSVLAPWHWACGHRIQALFCGLGVLIATAITTWNSLAFRSGGFDRFPTDTWADSVFPALKGISLTMVLAAIVPPFWGLFWAVVQPTQGKRSLAHLQESHAERMLRMQQEAEIKRLRAETNATVRAAQLKGMAQTAAAARDQAATLLRRGTTEGGPVRVHEDASGGHATQLATATPALRLGLHSEPPALPAPSHSPAWDESRTDDAPAVRPRDASAPSGTTAHTAEDGVRAAVDSGGGSRRRSGRRSLAQMADD